MKKEEYQQLADEAGWEVEDRGSNNLRFQPKDRRREIEINKPLESSVQPNVAKHVERLKLNHLTVDHRYQREMDLGWLSYLTSNWHQLSPGILTVSQRSDGSMVVLDGQHRREAMLKLGIPNTECEVFTGLTPKMEAELFDRLNTRRSVPPLMRYRARVMAGESGATKIDQTLHGLGTKVAPRADQGYPCVIALENAFRQGHLQDVVEILEASWPREPIRHSPIAVKAMTYFRQNYAGPDFKIDRAIKKFETVSLKSLAIAAKGEAAGNTQSQTWWLALALKKTYFGRKR